MNYLRLSFFLVDNHGNVICNREVVHVADHGSTTCESGDPT